MAIAGPPRIWVLLGHRSGDNVQVRELARLLEWPAELKQLHFNAAYGIPNLLLGASIISLNRNKSVPLEAPWPDLVLAIGRRSVPVAQWIRKQSGGKSKLVHLGRPRAPLSWFDLVITTPQYSLPRDPNVLELPLPLVSRQNLATADLDLWRKKFDGLPRPWTGVLVGGSRYPAVFDHGKATELAAMLAHLPGTALVSTSPRTGKSVESTLRSALHGKHFFHAFGEGGDNPHEAILRLADKFIVTSDSASMIAEAVVTEKPVSLYQVGRAPFAPSWQAQSGLPALLARFGLLVPPRNPRRIVLPPQRPSFEAIIARISALFTRF